MPEKASPALVLRRKLLAALVDFPLRVGRTSVVAVLSAELCFRHLGNGQWGFVLS